MKKSVVLAICVLLVIIVLGVLNYGGVLLSPEESSDIDLVEGSYISDLPQEDLEAGGQLIKGPNYGWCPEGCELSDLAQLCSSCTPDSLFSNNKGTCKEILKGKCMDTVRDSILGGSYPDVCVIDGDKFAFSYTCVYGRNKPVGCAKPGIKGGCECNIRVCVKKSEPEP